MRHTGRNTTRRDKPLSFTPPEPKTVITYTGRPTRDASAILALPEHPEWKANGEPDLSPGHMISAFAEALYFAARELGRSDNERAISAAMEKYVWPAYAKYFTPDAIRETLRCAHLGSERHATATSSFDEVVAFILEGTVRLVHKNHAGKHCELKFPKGTDVILLPETCPVCGWHVDTSAQESVIIGGRVYDSPFNKPYPLGHHLGPHFRWVHEECSGLVGAARAAIEARIEAEMSAGGMSNDR